MAGFYTPYGGNYGQYGGTTPQIPTQQMQQVQQVQQPQSGAYTCRPVTCREEAVAAQTDFFSLGTLMPDLNHGVIYLKRFNPNTGGSDFAEFRFFAPPQPAAADPAEYVTRKEFEAFARSIRGEAEPDAE